MLTNLPVSYTLVGAFSVIVKTDGSSAALLVTGGVCCAGGGDINGPHLSIVTASAAAVLTLLKRLLNIVTVNIVTTQHTQYQVNK